jgi:hypothetical protein
MVACCGRSRLLIRWSLVRVRPGVNCVNTEALSRRKQFVLRAAKCSLIDRATVNRQVLNLYFPFNDS